VSLQGTLDTLSLPELCELLSGTNKTGALHVRAEAGQGVLWFTGGKVCAGEAGGQKLPSQFGPWHAIGVIRADKEPPFNVKRDVIEQAIAGPGYQLFKVKPKVAAAG